MKIKDWPQHFNNTSELIVFARSWEERQPEEKFHSNATKRPHIDSGGVRHAKKYFGWSIETRLDIRVDCLTFMTSGTEVNNFDLGWLKPEDNVKALGFFRIENMLTHDFKRMFSGLRSQCIRRASLRTVKASSNCAINTFTSCVLKPWNWFCLINS